MSYPYTPTPPSTPFRGYPIPPGARRPLPVGVLRVLGRSPGGGPRRPDCSTGGGGGGYIELLRYHTPPPPPPYRSTPVGPPPVPCRGAPGIHGIRVREYEGGLWAEGQVWTEGGRGIAASRCTPIPGPQSRPPRALPGPTLPCPPQRAHPKGVLDSPGAGRRTGALRDGYGPRGGGGYGGLRPTGYGIPLPPGSVYSARASPSPRPGEHPPVPGVEVPVPGRGGGTRRDR